VSFLLFVVAEILDALDDKRRLTVYDDRLRGWVVLTWYVFEFRGRRAEK
jgi:hypothetical protein